MLTEGSLTVSQPISISEGFPQPVAKPVPMKGAADVQFAEEEAISETQCVVGQASAHSTKSRATFICTIQEHIGLLRGFWGRRQT